MVPRTLDNLEAGERALAVITQRAAVDGYKPTAVDFGKIEWALAWLIRTEPPYDCWDMLDNRVVYPILWLQNRYKHIPLDQLRCPTGVLRAFARRHPDLVYQHAAGPVRHRFVLELAAYLDTLAAGAAVDAALSEL